MTRNLKVLGLALLAAFAMSAVAASAASAQQGELTSDGPVFLTGTEELTGNSLEYPGLPKAECPGSHFFGAKAEETPHEPLDAAGETEFTVVPEYTNCKVGIFPATVVPTTCDFRFAIDKTTGAGDTYGLDASVECVTMGDVIHLEVYSDGGHTNRICTITFGEQTVASDLHATDNTEGDVIVSGIATNIHAVKSGGGCGGPGTTTAAKYNVNVKMTGENEEEGQTDIGISHG